jgi:hypothetical protein
MPSWSRRDILALGLASSLSPLGVRLARALGPGSLFRIGHLQLGSRWNPHPTALRRLSWELEKRTSIEVALEPATVTLASPQLHATPFLYLAGDREFELPPPAGVEALRRFLTFGGFLFVDSCEGRVGGDFDAAVRRLSAALFPAPAAALAPLPDDHVIYKSFYLVDRAVGRLDLAPRLEGLVHDGRACIVYSQNDMGGAFARDNYGRWDFECHPGGEHQREMAFRLGVNIAMYALCLDYKSDQVHVPFIMKRRRWRVEGGE